MSYISEPTPTAHFTSTPVIISGRDNDMLDLATLESLAKGIIEVLNAQNATYTAPMPQPTPNAHILDLATLESLAKGVIEILNAQNAANTAPVPQSTNTAPMPLDMLPVPYMVWETSTEAIWYPAGGNPSTQKVRLLMEAEERRRQTDGFPDSRGQHFQPKDRQAVPPMKRKREDEDADDRHTKDESANSKTGPCQWSTCRHPVGYSRSSLEKHLATEHERDLHPSPDDGKVPCRWSNCECRERLKPSSLGRHIATAQVHGLLAEQWRCEWCNKRQSRKDIKARHYTVCEVLKPREEGRSEKRKDERPAKIQRKY